MFWSHIANLLTAISIVGLSVLGVISESITFGAMTISAIVIGIIGVAGRWLDSTIDDEKEYDDTDN